MGYAVVLIGGVHATLRAEYHDWWREEGDEWHSLVGV